MVRICWLCLGMLGMGQVPETTWQLAPRLETGLELAYTGTFTEEALVPGVHFQRNYRLATTILVLDSAKDHWEVAVMTVLNLKGNGPESEKASPHSVRLGLGQVNRRGRLREGSLNISLTGPPTIETGALVELPAVRVNGGQTWTTTETGRPPLTWQLVGRESCNGASCVKLVGQQQSDDWDRPRADHTAWRRRETVWLAPQVGIAYRVERTIERRDPARREPTLRLTVRYDLATRLLNPGKLFEDRQMEITRALQFSKAAAPLLAKPGDNRNQIDFLLEKINAFMKYHRETPYRRAIEHVYARLDKARKGEFPAESSGEEKVDDLIPVVKVGQRAPDFVVTNLLNKQSVWLKRLRGRPVLIVFYKPMAQSGPPVLRFARELQEKYRTGLTILALADTNDEALACRQHDQMKLPFAVLDGRGLHITFGVEATPRIILLDADGVVRSAVTGWGPQVPREIEADLRPLLPR